MRALVSGAAALMALPEFNVLLFAWLLNFPWEILQSPLFAGMSDQRHWVAVRACTQAAMGDGAIMLIAYWMTAWLRRGRRWIIAPTAGAIGTFLLIGLCITIVIEWLALRGWWLERWYYTAAMPLIPGLRVGWVPALQWVILPPLVVAIVSRQIRGR